MTITVQCAECSLKFTTKRPNQQFCTPEHKTKFHALMLQRGQLIMPMLLARSMGRHTKGDQLGGYCRREADALIARWNISDREAGRRPDLIMRVKQEAGWKACDAGYYKA